MATKTSYSMEENKYLDSDSVHIFTKGMTLEEYLDALNVNGTLIPGTLKSSNFSEAITGEKMLANLTYRVVSTWT